MNGRDPFPELVLRPVSNDDVDELVNALHRLSPESLYQRFFTLPPDPAPLVRQHLAIVDHRDHEALVVLEREAIVAVGQWDRLPSCRHEAVVAIHVVDAWQHRGLGRALVRAVAGDAHRHGVVTLVAEVLTENRDGRGLAARQGPASVKVEGPQTLYRFDLAS